MTDNYYNYTIRGGDANEMLVAGTDTIGDTAWFSGTELHGAKELYADDGAEGDILFLLVDGRKAWFQSIDLGLEFTNDESISRTIIYKK